MQGPGPGPRRPHPPVRQGSGASSSSQRRASILSGNYRSQAGSCRRQSTTSDGRAVDWGSLVGNKYIPRVFDDEGKDVTPHPLFHPDPSMAVPRQGKFLASPACPGATGSGASSSSSLHQASGVNAGEGAFSRTHGSSSTSVVNTSNFILEERGEPGSQQDTTVQSSDVQVERGERTEEPTEDHLDRRVDIYLRETETLWMLDIPPVVVSTESEDAGRVQERNRIYVDICKNRPGNDRFVEKMMQTIHGAAKNKEAQCDKIIMEDKGMMVTSWDLYHSFNLTEAEPTSQAEGSRAVTGKSSQCPTSQEHHQTVSLSSDRGSTTSSIPSSESAVPTRIHEEKECHSEAILSSESLLQDLFFMERILMENIFQPKLAAYRQLPVLRDPDVPSTTRGTTAAVKEAKWEKYDKEPKSKEEQKEAIIDPSILSESNKTPGEVAPPRLEWLWSYSCDLTHEHSMSSMAWSKVNPDLLAVGYGAFDFRDQKKGLACCWSLKNPRWPERVLRGERGVTALDFSLGTPSLLAVGMSHGSITIWNLRSRKDPELLNSSDSTNNHTGPVWQLRWVEQDGGANKEKLFSVSADGRVTQWLVQNRLDCIDLMKIKRKASEKKTIPGKIERKSEVLISQQAAGMCFDFHPKDPNLYLAGTEEGLIHLCSCSCSEQFLNTYRGHKGPVYKVAWNPFSLDTFLSCSADWSIIFWHQDSPTPIFTFSSAAACVHDVMWSPKSASVFAAVKENRVEIWDLGVSTLDPTTSCFASPGVTFTSLLFAKNTDCLLVGDSRGEVNVFLLQNLAGPSSNEGAALRDIIGPAATSKL